MCLNVSAQDNPASFLNNLCDFKTDGTGKSAGLKIKLSYPCMWLAEDGERPHVIKKFSYGIGNESSLVQVFSIHKMAAELSKKEIEAKLSQNGLKGIANSIGTFISGRKLKIDGIDCGEIIVKSKKESPIATVNIYNLYYYIIYKDKTIILSFAVSALKASEAKSHFTIYKTLFQAIATKTIFLSKWE